MGLLPAGDAAAFATLQEEWDGNGTTVCGTVSAKVGLSYAPCDVGFNYDSSITSRGWDAVVRGGAYNWCNHPDPTHGTGEDFCWEDVTYGGQTAGANVSATDLGYNANGSYTLGDDSNTVEADAYYGVTGYFTLVNAQVQINSNPAVPWYVNANRAYAVPFNQIDMQTAVTHEMGHALGLNHPTQTDNGPGTPVMACMENYGISNHTSADDVNGELWLYGGHSSTWGSPQASPC